MLKAVIFDMDGVLVNSEPFYYKAERKLFSELGLDISAEEHASFVGGTGKDMWKYLKSKYPIDKSLDELIKLGRKCLMESLEGNIEPVTGVERLINDIVDNGVELALATSASVVRMKKVLQVLGFEKYFANKVCADDVLEGKPSPEIFLKAAAGAGVEPSGCVVIEDSENGILAAKKAGMKAVGIVNTGATKQDLSLADLVISSFGEIGYKELAKLFS